MTQQIAYVDAPDGRTIQVGPSEIEFLQTLVDAGPFPSVTAWVRAHLGRDHGYRREDAWRYVEAGMAETEVDREGRNRRGEGPATYGQVHAPLHTKAVVAWFREQDENPNLRKAIDEGWTIRPGSHPLAPDRTAPGDDGGDLVR